tara:strand:- start:746 stop:1195 length:450 start_codon:yes stop_codon:yes gene_type:complete
MDKTMSNNEIEMSRSNFNVDHIAHAVPNIEDAISQYKRVFGAKASNIKIIEKQDIKIAIVSFANLKIELMEPLSEKSPIASYLQKNPKGGLHHYCLSVDDVNQSYEDQKEKKINIISEPTKGYHGRNLYFIHPSEVCGALIEVEEHEKE